MSIIPFHYTADPSLHGVVESQVIAAALNARAVRSVAWECSAGEIPAIAGAVQTFSLGRDRQVLVVRAALTASVTVGDGSARVSVAASTTEAIEAFVAEVRKVLPRTIPDPAAPMVPVTFWSLSSMGGASSRRRQITVPTWFDLLANYPQSIADALHALMDRFVPGAGGQLLLWHGAPGTGKTYALRALAWEWRAWCDLHYITDPEVFFGHHASYMLDVLMDGGDSEPVALVGGMEDEQDEPRIDPRAADGKWRLLVLEDTGEMMSADARERAGQGLGRLLNVVDGMIGQGLKILVLVTTNERIARLHEAVARPGRCASRLYFDAMPIDEAREWLDDHGVDAPEQWAFDQPQAVTIADLFAILAGAPTSREREPASVGFTP